MDKNFTDGPGNEAREKLEKAVRLLEYYRNTDIGPLRARLAKTIRSSIRHRRIRRLLRFSATAAAVLSLAGGIWFADRQHRDEMPERAIGLVMDDIRLIMPDGREIILDRSSADGRIAEQDNIAILMEDGRLKFDRLEEHGPHTAGTAYGAIRVPRGTRFDMVLEDGTRVWLNADSELRFPTKFAGDERKVYLTGEAYFEVAANPLKSFTVLTGEQELSVLGTSFNISAYPDDSFIHTTLISGRVRLATPQQTVNLIPGLQAQMTPDGLYTVENVETGEVTAWKDGTFVFDGNTLEKVFRKLARWYDFDYSFDSEETAGFQLKGEIPVYDNIDRILNLIESSGRITCRRKNKELFITRRQ